MIDITKAAAAGQTNRESKPVEPANRTRATGDETRRSAEEAIAAIKQQATRGEAPTRGEIEQLADNINDFMKQSNLALRISVDEGTQIFITKIINEETGEVIKQFPPDQIVAIANRLKEMQNGVLVDEQT